MARRGVLGEFNTPRSSTNVSMELNTRLQMTEELREVEVRRVPFGTFAGTVNRLVILENGESQAMDTGDQGRPELKFIGRASGSSITNSRIRDPSRATPV